MKKRQLGSCVTFFPQPTTLIASCDDEGQYNLMTASWAGIVSKTPPTMAISLNQSRKTYENIVQSGCFSVNMVPASLAVEADFCGLKSGRDLDKSEVTGLCFEKAIHIDAPLVQSCPLNVECRCIGEYPLGDYRLIMGEILEIHAADEAFDGDGKMDARIFDPLVYLGGIREYWNLGEKVAQAYQDGLKLTPRK